MNHTLYSNYADTIAAAITNKAAAFLESKHPRQTTHSIELALRAVGVRAHASENQPVLDIEVFRHHEVLDDNVHAVAGLSEDGAVPVHCLGQSGLDFSLDVVIVTLVVVVVTVAVAVAVTAKTTITSCTVAAAFMNGRVTSSQQQQLWLQGLLLLMLIMQHGVELVADALETGAVHEEVVESVVESLVDMEAESPMLEALAQDSGGEVEAVIGEVSSWLCDDAVAERVVSGLLQDFNQRLRQVALRESAAQIEHGHAVSVFASDGHAHLGEFDGLVEGGGAVVSGAAVEVDALDVESKCGDFSEARFSVFGVDDVVAELAGKRRGQLLLVVFGDGDAPQHAHDVLHVDLADLVQLVQSVCSGEVNLVCDGELHVALVLHRVGVDYLLRAHAQRQQALDLVLGGRVVVAAQGLQVVQQARQRVRLYRVVDLDPRQLRAPALHFAHRLFRLVHQERFAQRLVVDYLLDLLLLIQGEWVG